MSVVDLIKRYLCNVVSATSIRLANLKVDGLFGQSYAVITALGADAVGAAPLGVQFTRVTGGATGTGVSLPATTISSNQLSGVTYTVRNDSVAGALISVYPGIINGAGTIDNGAVGAAYTLPWKSTQTFTTTNGIAWFTSQFTMGGAGVVTLADAGPVTLTVSQIGATFLVPTATATRVLNLPAANTLPMGAKYTFVATAAGGGGANVFTITPNAGAADTLQGCVCRQTTVLQVAAAVNISFSTAYKQGDWLEVMVVSPVGGANCWLVKGIGSNVASFA